jgi:thiol-disulfide isomerase/thioredoxin
VGWPLGLGVLTLGLLALSCGGAGSAEGFAANADPAAQADGEGDGGAAFDFTLDTLDGRTVSLSDSTGKVRLIDFWATWCVPCREEIPMLNELQAEYAERGFEVMAISDFDEETGVVRDFVDANDIDYLNLVGTEEVRDAYGVLGLPAAFLIDAEGRVTDTFLGPKPRRVLVKKIEALLEQGPST